MLLDEDYTARLTDFGFASLAGNISEALIYLQRSTATPGALRWRAPEQVDPEETFSRTTKTDIYSFGCVALQESPIGHESGVCSYDFAGVVRKRTMVGNTGRCSSPLTLGEGPQTRPARVSNHGRLALEFNSKLLVTSGGAQFCRGDNTHHSTVLELLPAVPSPL